MQEILHNEVKTMTKNHLQDDLPLGFGLALAQNTRSLIYFSALSAQERKNVVEGAKNVTSKEEMRDYVNKIVTL